MVTERKCPGNIMEFMTTEQHIEHSCYKCFYLTEYFLSKNPGRKGQAFCAECMLNLGISPINFPVDFVENIDIHNHEKDCRK